MRTAPQRSLGRPLRKTREVVAIDVEQIIKELEQFTGTERYYRSTFGRLLLTDGVHYLRERLNCYWLVDVVESYQPEPPTKEFQLWSIKVNADKSALVEMREDTGLRPVVSQQALLRGAG